MILPVDPESSVLPDPTVAHGWRSSDSARISAVTRSMDAQPFPSDSPRTRSPLSENLIVT